MAWQNIMKQLLALTGAVKIFCPSFVFEDLFHKQGNVSQNFPPETPDGTRHG